MAGRNLPPCWLDGRAADNNIPFESGYGLTYKGETSALFSLESATRLRYPDGVIVTWGTGNDFAIVSDGTNAVTQGSGSLVFADSQALAFGAGKDTVLTPDGTDTVVSGAGDLVFSDDYNLYFGAGKDLRFVHDASDSYIESTTGSLIIDNQNATGNTYMDLGDDVGATSFIVRNDSGVAALTVGSSGTVEFKGNEKAVGTIASAQQQGGIPVIYRYLIADAASANYDVVTTAKIEVYDVQVIKTEGAGGAADTVTVQNGANAITDAIDTNIADKAVARAGEIDDANHQIASGGTLRIAVNNGGAGNAGCLVIVKAYKVA
jgi:hypothetical protein